MLQNSASRNFVSEHVPTGFILCGLHRLLLNGEFLPADLEYVAEMKNAHADTFSIEECAVGTLKILNL